MRHINVMIVKKALNSLLDHVIDSGLENIPLNEQYYWKVLDDEKHTMDKNPVDLGIGDLFFDLDVLEDAAVARGQTTALTLTEVGDLLVYIGRFAGEALASKGG